MHRTCRPSQIFAISAAGHAPLPDTFSVAWRGTLRMQSPRAIFIRENKTNFDGWDEHESGSASRFLEAFGFERADGPIDGMAPPRARHCNTVYRADQLELQMGDLVDQGFPERQSEAWRMAAEQDGEILMLYGTALGLDHCDDDRLGRRIDAGKVVAAIVPFRQERRHAGRLSSPSL